MNKKFSFEFYGHVNLDIDDIWPDGETPQVPEDPTPQDVVAHICQMYGHDGEMNGYDIYKFLTEWNLVYDVKVNVDGLPLCLNSSAS